MMAPLDWTDVEALAPSELGQAEEEVGLRRRRTHAPATPPGCDELRDDAARKFRREHRRRLLVDATATHRGPR